MLCIDCGKKVKSEQKRCKECEKKFAESGERTSYLLDTDLPQAAYVQEVPQKESFVGKYAPSLLRFVMILVLSFVTMCILFPHLSPDPGLEFVPFQEGFYQEAESLAPIEEEA